MGAGTDTGRSFNASRAVIKLGVISGLSASIKSRHILWVYLNNLQTTEMPNGLVVQSGRKHKQHPWTCTPTSCLVLRLPQLIWDAALNCHDGNPLHIDCCAGHGGVKEALLAPFWTPSLFRGLKSQAFLD